MAPQRGSNQRRPSSVSRTHSEPALAGICPTYSVKRVVPLIGGLFAPLTLIYLVLRCQMNQCVLYQFPLIVPTHAGAFVSLFSFILVPAFIALMYFIKFSSKPPKEKSFQVSLNSGLTSLILTSLILVGVFYIRHEYVDYLYSNYVRYVVVTTILSVLFAIGLLLADYLHWLPKAQFDHHGGGLSAFFWGRHSHIYVGAVELKSFLYINVGLVAWGALDLLIFLHFINHRSPTGPLTFLVFTQLLFIGHSLLYEHYLLKKPYRETEGLGFFWLMRVLLFLPFFHSLPVLCASETEIVLPKPALLSDLVLFFFGFIVYLSAVHQKENFNADPTQYRYKPVDYIHTSQGKRLLICGYWSVVQKPDYLGYMIIWLSWAIACGFSGMSVLVLITMYVTIFAWYQQLAKYNRSKLGNAWQRYTSTVKSKILPLVL